MTLGENLASQQFPWKELEEFPCSVIQHISHSHRDNAPCLAQRTLAAGRPCQSGKAAREQSNLRLCLKAYSPSWGHISLHTMLSDIWIWAYHVYLWTRALQGTRNRTEQRDTKTPIGKCGLWHSVHPWMEGSWSGCKTTHQGCSRKDSSL